MTVRPLRAEDAAECASLEKGEGGQDGSGWTAGKIESALLAGNGGWAIVAGEAMVACILVRIAASQLEILHLAVSAARRGEGYARQLLTHAVEKARQAGADEAWLEVRRSNGPAIGLYRSCGFLDVGMRKGYYPGSVPGQREDARVMTLKLVR